MTERPLRPEARAVVEAFGQGLADIAARTEQARAALQNSTATATGGNGAVTVTADTSGVLVDVQFALQAREIDPNELARLVLATARDAQLAALRATRAALVEAVGADSGAVRVLDRDIAALTAP